MRPLLLADFSVPRNDAPIAFLPYLLIVAIPSYAALTVGALAARAARPRWLLLIGIVSLGFAPFLWALREAVRTFLAIASATLLVYFAPMMERASVMPAVAVAVWAVLLGAASVGAGLSALGQPGRVWGAAVLLAGLGLIGGVVASASRPPPPPPLD